MTTVHGIAKVGFTVLRETWEHRWSLWVVGVRNRLLSYSDRERFGHLRGMKLLTGNHRKTLV